MSEIDKDFLYGKYQEAADWRSRLHKKLAHKSLDIPEDDDLHVQQNKTGITWRELAVLAAAGLGGGYLYTNKNETTSSASPVAVSPVDSEYEIRFFDGSGNAIEIPNISSRPEQ